MHEEAILAWVLELYVSTPDIIENVDRKTLQVLINDVDHLAVFFCELMFPFFVFDCAYYTYQSLYLYSLQTRINAISAKRY